MIKIIEEFIRGKRPDQSKCEDGYIIKPHLIAVVDGVTSKGNHLWSGVHTSGCMAKNIILDFLSGDVEDLNAEELFCEINKMLRKAYSEELSEDISTERLKACIAVYNEKFGEIWTYGDCQCIINGKVYRDSREIEDILANKRANILKNAIAGGMTVEELMCNDIGRKGIFRELRNVALCENKDCEGGYPVLNGVNIIREMIKKYNVPESSEVVMASDGYPVLCSTLTESEKELKRIITDDPLCIYDFVSTKGIGQGNEGFDDRTYIRFSVL